jgi:hypothetical protein
MTNAVPSHAGYGVLAFHEMYRKTISRLAGIEDLGGIVSEE